jgi:flagellar basal body-associated protein FliL
MEPKICMGARSLTVGGLSAAGALVGLGDQHAWIALVALIILLALVVVLAMMFNIRIEVDERHEDGRRHRELRVTRRAPRHPPSR